MHSSVILNQEYHNGMDYRHTEVSVSLPQQICIRQPNECGFAVSPHRFRHTLASTLMAAPDGNLQLVRGLLGHSNISMTMEYIDINLAVVGETLERELALHTDLYGDGIA